MAEIKTARTGASVAEFLDAVPDEQVRRDCWDLVEFMSAATRAAPAMWGPSIVGFGTYQLNYADGREIPWMLMGFSPRKQNISLYLGCDSPRLEALLAGLGKHSRAKSCLYVRRLSDIHVPTLKKLLQASARRIGVKTSRDSARRRSSKPSARARTPARRAARR